MTPEQKARQKIDQQLDQCGWMVQDYRQMNISAGRGVAVREFPLNTGEADYLLYADAKAIGVIEAKPEDHTLTGVELQSAKYTSGLPNGCPITTCRCHSPTNPPAPKPVSPTVSIPIPAAGKSSPSIGPRN